MARIAVLLARAARHAWPAKDPAETVDYAVDWTARLAVGDAIETSTFELPKGLISPKASNTDKVATVFLSGGAAGSAYEIVNRITTRGGAAFEQAIRLRVKTR